MKWDELATETTEQADTEPQPDDSEVRRIMLDLLLAGASLLALVLFLLLFRP